MSKWIEPIIAKNPIIPCKWGSSRDTQKEVDQITLNYLDFSGELAKLFMPEFSVLIVRCRR